MAKAKKTSSEKVELSVELRTVIGKKVRAMRREGKIPGNIFGVDYVSKSIAVPSMDFMKAFKIAKETGIVYIKLDSENIPTLIKAVQRHPVNHSILHVDFRKIDLKQKIETQVPVQTVGTSEAVSQKGAVLLTQANELTIEALPQDIPQFIEVDISSLKELGQEIKVSDLQKVATYTITDDAEKVIVSATAHKEESLVAETASVAPEVITEKAAEEGAEGAPAAADDKKAPAEKKSDK